jgi:hypothetical protein
MTGRNTTSRRWPGTRGTVAGKKVLVHPSDGLRKDVAEIVHILE